MNLRRRSSMLGHSDLPMVDALESCFGEEVRQEKEQNSMAEEEV